LFPIGDIPHPWLFQHIRAAIHHGGAGTTAASLRAGLPTAITPVGVDQFFWGERVAALGVGPRLIPQRALDAGRLVGLIHELIENPVYRSKAREIGARLRSESGVTLAAGHIQAILF
jgi:UDP:flavonoid glycosyltransferase YjiC (YdhE family)